MKTWIIASLIFGLLIVGGMAAVNAISDNSDNTIEPVAEKTISCSSCGNGCTADNNCGLATCGAVSGTGSCGCGQE